MFSNYDVEMKLKRKKLKIKKNFNNYYLLRFPSDSTQHLRIR